MAKDSTRKANYYGKKPPGPKPGQAKKSIPGPTTVSAFFGMLIMRLSKKVLLVDTGVKIGVYCIIVVAGSIICDLFRPPLFYIASKDSVFNVYFVKLGWGWTLLICGCFMLITSYTYSCCKMNLVYRHMTRLLVGTAQWWLWVGLFNNVEHASGFCTSDAHDNKTACVKSGHLWLGFDISGHTFLLMHCLLIISEEAKCLRRWERITEFFRDETKENDHPRASYLSYNDAAQLKTAYTSLGPYVKLSAALLALLMVLWEMMLLITSLYYHTLIQKFIAACIAIGTWFLTYQVWYKQSWSPGLPGYGPVVVA